jgi:hypothetical protein
MTSAAPETPSRAPELRGRGSRDRLAHRQTVRQPPVGPLSARIAASEGVPTPPPIDPDRWRARGVGSGFGNVKVATPEPASHDITQYLAGSPVEAVYMWASIANLPEELAVRQVQTTCSRLASLLRNGDSNENGTQQ